MDGEQFRVINGGDGGGGMAMGRGGRENKRPPGMDPTRADHDRNKQANLIGRSVGNDGGGGGTRRGGAAKGTSNKPAWGRLFLPLSYDVIPSVFSEKSAVITFQSFTLSFK